MLKRGKLIRKYQKRITYRQEEGKTHRGRWYLGTPINLKWHLIFWGRRCVLNNGTNHPSNQRTNKENKRNFILWGVNKLHIQNTFEAAWLASCSKIVFSTAHFRHQNVHAKIDISPDAVQFRADSEECSVIWGRMLIDLDQVTKMLNHLQQCTKMLIRMDQVSKMLNHLEQGSKMLIRMDQVT